jgi:DNA-binding LacI/PurR family transcriptional regulator
LAKIYDVAKLAGVSTATVSAVVNGQNTVEARTRRRVLAAIKKLHYQPNLYASNLARGTTRLLGLIVSDIVNPFFGEIAQSIRQEALARGYEVSLASTQFSGQDLVLAVKRMIGMRVAGLAIMTTEMNAQILEILRNHRTPSVFEDVGTVSDTISNIRIDYEGGIFKAVKYLVDIGHKKILFVRSYPDTEQHESAFLSIRLRTSAFQEAVNKFRPDGIEGEIVTCPGPGPKAGQQAIHKAAEELKFTAAIAIADPVALGVLRGLQQRGLRVPEDVSLIGFDNSYLCEYLHPPLTSVNIPRNKLGRMVVDCLVRNVENKEPGRELALETDLIIRESTSRFTEGNRTRSRAGYPFARNPMAHNSNRMPAKRSR